MSNDNHPAPRQYAGVMVSSTFTDLEPHRAALIKAINGQGLTHVAMEDDPARPDVDVIDSSLQKVREASAFIGVISLKYGQTPACPNRNPRKLSITELEFNEAQRLERPILLFIMGDDHVVRKADVEINATKIKKLNAFRERAKQMKRGSPVHRVYDTFDNLEEFTSKAIHAVAGLRRYLDERDTRATQPQTISLTPEVSSIGPNLIPAPPAFYAEPPYIGSHEFVGRQAQLDVLNDWAAPADPHPVLLFEAIGGSGKSMLTWHWAKELSTRTRTDWAGCFWYSFYERGAIMADFCQRALAYITGKPLNDFGTRKTPELGELLLHHFRARPWLLILDGLERVLVAYHRFDAAQVPDEDCDKPTDQIAHRDPCASIRPEDDDLLRALAAAAPSKLLMTSRLVPRVLLNRASQPIPGVLRASLPGLRPADAEALLRSCGISGGSPAIQEYLKRHCDCHPLVTGILAGLINDYLPAKGNFDAWAADPIGGGQLNLAHLDLIQKRNHILTTALSVLPGKSRQLLSTLALLSEAADYPTLKALYPHLHPGGRSIKVRSGGEANRNKQSSVRLQSDESIDQELANTVRDLEHRGLLQYDAHSRRYDLHPVVRGIAAGGLRQEDKVSYGKQVVDHFSRQPHVRYKEANTLLDVHTGLHVIRTLIQMGRYQKAANAYRDGLGEALYVNLEAHAEVLSLLRPLFPKGWAILPKRLDKSDGAYLANCAGNALDSLGESEHAARAYEGALLTFLRLGDWANAVVNLTSIATSQKRLAVEERCLKLAITFAELAEEFQLFPTGSGLFASRLSWYHFLCRVGRWKEANEAWQELDRTKHRVARYAIGYPDLIHAHSLFWQGDLTEERLAEAEERAKQGKARAVICRFHALRGEWRLAEGQWSLASESLNEAVRMAREAGRTAQDAEAQLALAKFHLQQVADPRHEAEQLAKVRRPSHLALAELWLAIGDHEEAKRHALAGYESAWADGEPYVLRFELNKARALLEKLDAEIPRLSPYDPEKDEKPAWEDDVIATVERLRAEKETKTRKAD
jgi:hypothetical protein